MVAGEATTLSVLPPVIQRALAIAAYRRPSSTRDVEHIVILMQENRSFDHYFGRLRGVGGFADPFPIPRPNTPGMRRNTVWHRPNESPTAPLQVILPFQSPVAYLSLVEEEIDAAILAS